MADKRTRRSGSKNEEERDSRGEVRGAELHPIRHVKRELTRPDGSKLVVKVPVYPPFKLRDHSAPETRVHKRVPEKKAS